MYPEFRKTQERVKHLSQLKLDVLEGGGEDLMIFSFSLLRMKYC